MKQSAKKCECGLAAAERSCGSKEKPITIETEAIIDSGSGLESVPRRLALKKLCASPTEEDWSVSELRHCHSLFSSKP
jgi:hypothetical protein